VSLAYSLVASFARLRVPRTASSVSAASSALRWSDSWSANNVVPLRDRGHATYGIGKCGPPPRVDHPRFVYGDDVVLAKLEPSVPEAGHEAVERHRLRAIAKVGGEPLRRRTRNRHGEDTPFLPAPHVNPC